MNDFLPFTRPTIDESTIEGVAEVLRSGWLATGPNVTRFEQALKGYLGGEREVMVMTSGTAALELALEACGIGEGDEVIVPAMTFASTANVVLRVGATPVFVDVDLRSRNILIDQAEAAITDKTRAIMPVHFSGLPVEHKPLYELARRHNLRVIEDAAHAIGSAWSDDRVGSLGDMVCFSFHPNKNMTTIEGGALVVADPDEAERIRTLRFHGIERLDDGTIDVVAPGGKYNLSDVSARIGLDQLEKLDDFNQRRRELAYRYFEFLEDKFPGVLPARGDEGHSWHMFAVLLPFDELGMSRQDFIKAMGERNIGCGVHYPALHEMTLYRPYQRTPCPNASRIGRETVTLPLFPAMSMEDVERVCVTMNEVLNTAA
jgi:dTDP-4-amino-4,6-dideoxygalactose transaminase